MHSNGRLRDPEINHDGLEHALRTRRHQYIGGFDVAVNHSLLMGMLDRVTNLHKESQPLLGRERMLVAVLRNLGATDQLHHEVGPA